MRFLPVLAILAVAMSAPLAAGQHDPPDDSSDLGRAAEPRTEPDSPPPAPEPAPEPEPPPPSPPPSEAPGASPSDSGGSEPRVAVPRTDSDDSHKQRPRTGSQDDGGGHSGGGDDGGPGYYRSGDDCDDRYEASQDSPAPSVRTTGALDIDVSPGKTEVWIDGRYVGRADDFDGFPHYLWLEAGFYDLVLYREGYTTLCRRIRIAAGSSISITDRMRRGTSVRPEDVAGRQGNACRPLAGL